jgi:hypothetical protein
MYGPPVLGIDHAALCDEFDVENVPPVAPLVTYSHQVDFCTPGTSPTRYRPTQSLQLVPGLTEYEPEMKEPTPQEA